MCDVGEQAHDMCGLKVCGTPRQHDHRQQTVVEWMPGNSAPTLAFVCRSLLTRAASMANETFQSNRLTSTAATVTRSTQHPNPLQLIPRAARRSTTLFVARLRLFETNAVLAIFLRHLASQGWQDLMAMRD